MLLGATLLAYALAMTVGPARPSLMLAGLGLALFLLVEARAAAPLVAIGMLRDGTLSAGLVMSLLVSTVMMATLVVGPFYLARGLGLDAAGVGLVLSIGPLVAAIAAIPAGLFADRFGAWRGTIAGLACFAAGTGLMASAGTEAGIAGYAGAITVISAGYALFQTANNASVMAGAAADRRGVISGVLNLSRSIGLITGASMMGAVFAAASASVTDSALAAGHGLRMTFWVATGLSLTALGLARVRAKNFVD
jgi:MFS family permease